MIPRTIEALGVQCFRSCLQLSKIAFEDDSQLHQIQTEACFSCGLESIIILRSVEIINQ
jgi:hypothetical protein